MKKQKPVVPGERSETRDLDVGLLGARLQRGPGSRRLRGLAGTTEVADDIAIMKLPPPLEKLVRRYVDLIGMHRVCGHQACRRAGRCATREVMCYQVLREPINERLRPIVRARLEQEGLLPPSGRT